MKTSAVMLAVAVFATGAFAQGASAASGRAAHDADAAAKERRVLGRRRRDLERAEARSVQGAHGSRRSAYSAIVVQLIAGKFMPDAEQPIWFKAPKLFAPRPNNNSFYTSYTVQNGKGVLRFNDVKFFLLGRAIGPEWFK